MLQIKIRTKDDAFCNGNGDNNPDDVDMEVSRILAELADRIELGYFPSNESVILRDYNGNECGIA